MRRRLALVVFDALGVTTVGGRLPERAALVEAWDPPPGHCPLLGTPVRTTPDVAFLALAGRPNVSGEPYQGSAARYMLEQAETLRPGRVCFCHHDPLMPGLPGTDVAPAAALLEEHRPGSYFALEYATPWGLFP